jgi:hypothetical protein
VLPGETKTVELSVVPYRIGDFSAQLHLFIAEDQLREVVLTVEGTAKGKTIIAG